jgi:glycosyltransferase involved in cell wall biosynthesis
LLFSPAFVSPLWGAPALAVCVPDMYYAVIPELIDQRQRQYWSMFVPLSVRRCGLVLAISEQTRRDVERLLPVARGKVRVTPLASRLRPREAFQIGQPWRPYLLMVANLTANKNVEVVVEGLSMIRAQGLDLELVHVGRDHHDRLGTAVRRFGMDGHVRRLGKVSDERLEVLYREAFAAVNASLYEGFGMPAVEAQAMGAPLISSNHPALLEAAGDEGALFYDPTKAADLAMHVSNLWADSDARERLRLKGYHNAQKLTWEATARGTLAAFDELLTKTPGRR